MTKYLFVCISNYCRSPVAEKIFNNLNIDNTISKSAGINDFLAMNMDPRSQDYLNPIGIQDIDHQPRKVSYSLLSNSDKIFALDSFVFLFLKHCKDKFDHYHSSSRKFECDRKDTFPH